MGNAFETPSESYVAHRDKLRDAEIALKERCEEVAALRRELPSGPGAKKPPSGIRLAI